ncbi:MAG: hypothetical protein AABX16_01455 [Nanoarchaeota archaeon]
MDNPDDLVKSAFIKVKNDIDFLNEEILNLKISISDLKEYMLKLEKNQKDLLELISTIKQINPTNNNTPTHNPTIPQEVKGLKIKNFEFSTGSKGVPTDRQTDQQTDRQISSITKIDRKSINSNLQEASEILQSLDTLRREIRLKFKQLTPQEMLVFSTIYQLEEQFPQGVSYPLVAQRLSLTESSIRDYVHRMMHKGISLTKNKINNKKILIKISPELKKIATLSTIMMLREN